MMQKLRPLIERLLADRKRAGVVLGLGAVGLLLWGRLLLKQVPQTASADDTPQWLQEVEAELQDTFASGPAVRLAPPPPPHRDPFALDPAFYPETLSEDSEDEPAKLPLALTDEARQRAVVQAAGELRLQSLSQGKVPAAFINGRLVRLGGTVDGFTLLRCDDRSAVLSKDGFQVRLNMSQRSTR